MGQDLLYIQYHSWYNREKKIDFIKNNFDKIKKKTIWKKKLLHVYRKAERMANGTKIINDDCKYKL